MSERDEWNGLIATELAFCMRVCVSVFTFMHKLAKRERDRKIKYASSCILK